MLLHTGDFKLDPTPIDGRVTDLQGIGAEAERGVHVLLADSTNAEDRGSSGSEREVGPVLYDIIRDARGLVVVACFASHIHRVQQVATAARKCGRRVAFLGRSMLQSTQAARELGYLTIPDDQILDIDEVDESDPLQGRGHQHRLAGRADVGHVADGRPRAQVRQAAVG